MREITKSLSIPLDGKPKDFRLTKLDAFSGAFLLRMLSRLPEGEQGDGSQWQLANMLVRDRALEVVETKEAQKRLENDPENIPEAAEQPSSPAPAEAKASGRKSAEKKQ